MKLYDSNYVRTIEYNRLEHTTMRMTQIAKASLALGLLTTGASIVTTQSAKSK